MKSYSFILSVVRQLEQIFAGIISYAYKDENGLWWNVCVSDYSVYTSDRFRRLANAWHVATKVHGVKIVFCYCAPKEDRLFQLSQKDNLIMAL